MSMKLPATPEQLGALAAHISVIAPAQSRELGVLSDYLAAAVQRPLAECSAASLAVREYGAGVPAQDLALVDKAYLAEVKAIAARVEELRLAGEAPGKIANAVHHEGTRRLCEVWGLV